MARRPNNSACGINRCQKGGFMSSVPSPTRSLAAREGSGPRMGWLLALVGAIGVFWGLDTWHQDLRNRQKALDQQSLELTRLQRIVRAGQAADWANAAKQLESSAAAWEARLLETRDAQALKVALMSSYTQMLTDVQARGYNVLLTDRAATPSAAGNPLARFDGLAAGSSTGARNLGGSIGAATGVAGAALPTAARAAASAPVDASLVQTSAVLSASFDPKVVYDLMRALEELPHIARIDGLIVRANRFELTVTTLARLSPETRGKNAMAKGARP
jgi:hypothetical protein